MKQIDPTSISQQLMYKLLIGCVVPRPIAWISTMSDEGSTNLAPFSFFNVVASHPPTVSVSLNYKPVHDGRKDTLRNILATGEFVVNIVNETLAEAMNLTSVDFPPEISEFEQADLAFASSAIVRPPRVAASPVQFECRLLTHVPVGEGPGSSTLVIGQIVMVHIDSAIVDERYRVNLARLQPIARLAGADYAYVHETFAMKRGTYNHATGAIDYPDQLS